LIFGETKTAERRYGIAGHGDTCTDFFEFRCLFENGYLPALLG
jgi:hypothetical protein